MKIHWFFKRFFLFALVLLIFFPLIFSIFVKSPSFSFDLRTVFLLQKLYLTVVALTLVLLIVSFSKIKRMKSPKLDYKKQVFFIIIAIFFLSLSVYTQIDYDKILSQGVKIQNDKTNFDSSRYLSISILSDIDLNKGRNIFLEKNEDFVLRTVYLDKIPSNPEVKLYTAWFDRSDEGISPDCKVSLYVNDGEYDLSEKYLTMKNREWIWITKDINKDDLKIGDNKLVLKSKCIDAIVVGSQGVYVNHQTISFFKNETEILPFNEALLFINQDSGLFYNFIFKFGFIFRLIGVCFLFIAIFSFDFVKFLFKNNRLELFFAFIFSVIMYWFADIIRSYWYLLSYVVTYSTYFLLKISLLNPIIDMTNPTSPIVGTLTFTTIIADSCSGIDSIAYFIIAYLLLAVVNWNDLNKKNAFLFLIVGLIGTMLVNIFRIYLLFLIGIFYSKDFALNTYHTNAGMILFIIYFVIFWQFMFKYIKDNK